MYIGFDMVDVDRLEKSFESEAFIKKVYTKYEIDYIYSKKVNMYKTAAGIFSAKEAFSKAIGTGLAGVTFKELEVHHHEEGAPYIVLSGELLKRYPDIYFTVSITHTDYTAGAVVIGREKSQMV